MRIGIAHHYGWAVAVLATPDYEVGDRRRIQLIEPGLPPAPIHHEGGPHAMHQPAQPLSDLALAKLVDEVRSSVVRTTRSALDELAKQAPQAIESLSVRAWPVNFPDAIAEQRRPPYESRADSIMYCQILAEVARERGWMVHTYEARTVEDEATAILGERAHDVLHGPRRTLGAPWSKDHRMALAATVLAHPVV